MTTPAPRKKRAALPDAKVEKIGIATARLHKLLKELGRLLGASRNVHASLNRARFELRMGSHADRVLQAEWNRSGADGLAFDVLELLKDREDAHFDYASELKALEQIHRELQGLAP